jgi:acetyl-CoA carboxylase carboxyltransferase component
VPLIGIASGYCFAGNAALLGCCDVVIATEHSSIGMGGPAMIEGGGLGSYQPGEVGPIEVQYANGVVDLRVKDDRQALGAAKRYLSYFRGPADSGAVEKDQASLRHLIPTSRKRIYEVRKVIAALLDDVLELRRGFGLGIVIALARLNGHPLGVIANDPSHLGGAIDAHGADRAARFMQLCDGFELPLLFLCDTPGFMVGPAAERTATVRHFARMFVTGASLQVPTRTVILRKGYGLGAQAMAGGGFKAPLFTVGWPTSEFGAMGLEGAVRLGMRRELAAIEDPAERERAFEAAVAAAYDRGKGISTAEYFEIDDVIDPADTRRWIKMLVDRGSGEWWRRAAKRRPHIDAW